MLHQLTPLSKVVGDPMVRLDRGLDEHGLKVMRRVADLKVEYVDHPAFKSRTAATRLFAEKIDTSELERNWNLVFDEDSLKPGEKPRVLTVEEERILFLQFNFARKKVYRVIERAHTRRLSPKEAAEVVKWQEVADEIRNTLFLFNLPLVHNLGRKYGFIRWVEYHELLNAAEDALMNSIRKFNISFGFKFSTYLHPAIKRGFYRKSQKLVPQFTIKSEMDEWQHPIHRDDQDAHLREEELYDAIFDVLDDRERNVLLRRYLNYDILTDIANFHNVSKETIRHVLEKSINKLKEELVA